MKNSIKAMIMSAGVGSRLEPLTKFVPKPLVPIANKPVMDILFDNLLSIGIRDVVCNTYYLADKIINRYENNSHGLNFNYIKEETLSGTAGGVKKCQFFFEKGDTFVVLSADGLSNADIEKGIEIHRQSGAIATIGVKEIAMEEVPHFGVVVTDSNGFITEFQEKPSIEEAKSNLINTGIYIFDYKIFEYIPENTFYDFAKNVFPKLLSEHAINTFMVNEYWSDIGTIGQYIQSTKDLFENTVAMKEILNEKQAKYVNIINKNSTDVLYLIDKILELSKAESNLFEKKLGYFDAINILNNVIKNNEKDAQAKNIEINVEVAKDVKRTIYSDEAMLKIVLENIIESAIKFTDVGSINIEVSHPDLELVSEKGFLPVENAKEKSYIMFKIDDQSLGISDIELENLFEPYAQLDNPNKNNVFRSIAFSTIKNIIRIMKGNVWVEPEAMHGTTYCVIIPAEKVMQSENEWS